MIFIAAWSLKSPLSNGVLSISLAFTEAKMSSVYEDDLQILLLSAMSPITTLPNNDTPMKLRLK